MASKKYPGAMDNVSVSFLLEKLAETPYSCSSLMAVGGGTVNMVLRGQLTKTAQSDDGSDVETVIVKYSKGHISSNPDFLLDISRTSTESIILRALETFHPPVPRVKTPRLLFYDGEEHIQVMEDFANSVDLKTLMVSFPGAGSAALTGSRAFHIGHAVGSWLRSFHAWASAPEQLKLRAELGTNEPMRMLKRQVTYDNFMSVLENFPESLETTRETLEVVRQATREEFDRRDDPDDSLGWGPIHGDFWAGNILITRPETWGTEEADSSLQLCVIDAEFVQLGHWAYDLGQLVGDVYERRIFNDATFSLRMIDGIAQGYGPLSPDMAFRTAIHAGVHLLCWYHRRHPSAPVKGSASQIAEAIELGVSFIIKGWRRDAAWFQKSPIASLFADIK